jgi:uncharacterized protein with HEPN domain
MSKHETNIRYRHMLDNARKASAMASRRTRSDLDTDEMLSLALVRLLEVLGEAANRIPDDEQAQHPEIPWVQIVGLRNRLIHGYDSIDFDILWQVLRQDLPPLIQSLEKIVADAE